MADKDGVGEKSQVSCAPDYLDAEAMQPPSINTEAERRLLRKLDWRLMPLAMLLYLVAFFDRSNIGNAAIAGMPEALNLRGNELNVATSVLYVTYIIGEPPSTLLLRIVGPSKLIPTIVCSWSLVTIGTAFVSNYGQLLAVRLLLGLAESGLFPCLSLYLTQFYYRDEQAKRIALLFSASALSGAIGGLLAYGLIQIKTSTLDGWQWLFLVEGLLSLVVGFSAYFVLPDSLESCHFLTEEDRLVGYARRQRARLYASVDEEFQWSEIGKALKDPKLYMSGLGQFGADTSLYGFSTFLPVIIQALGFTTLQAQLLTIPVFVLGSIILLSCSIVADKIQRRLCFVIGLGALTAIGYSILVATGLSRGIYYLACFIVGAGVYTTVGLNLVALNINQAGHYKRATAIGVQLAMGNSAGVLAGQLYQKKSAPAYTVGHAVTLGCVGMCVALAICHLFYLKYCNSKRNALSDEEREQILARGGGEAKMGDYSPNWRYSI